MLKEGRYRYERHVIANNRLATTLQLTSRRDRKLKLKPGIAASQQKEREKNANEDLFVNNDIVIDNTYIFSTFSH